MQLLNLSKIKCGTWLLFKLNWRMVWSLYKSTSARNNNRHFIKKSVNFLSQVKHELKNVIRTRAFHCKPNNFMIFVAPLWCRGFLRRQFRCKHNAGQLSIATGFYLSGAYSKEHYFHVIEFLKHISTSTDNFNGKKFGHLLLQCTKTPKFNKKQAKSSSIYRNFPPQM